MYWQDAQDAGYLVRGPPAGLRHGAVSMLQGGAPGPQRMCMLHCGALRCAGKRPGYKRCLSWPTLNTGDIGASGCRASKMHPRQVCCRANALELPPDMRRLHMAAMMRTGLPSRRRGCHCSERIYSITGIPSGHKIFLLTGEMHPFQHAIPCSVNHSQHYPGSPSPQVTQGDAVHHQFDTQRIAAKCKGKLAVDSRALTSCPSRSCRHSHSRRPIRFYAPDTSHVLSELQARLGSQRRLQSTTSSCWPSCDGSSLRQGSRTF